MRYISIVLVLSILAIGCASSNTTPTEGRIPTKWEGEWKWIRTYGGIAGMTYTPERVGYTCTLRIDADDAFSSILRNDSVVCNMPYPIVGATDSTTNLSVRPDTLARVVQLVLPNVVLANTSFEIGVGRSNDTLFTWDRNVADGFESWFVKQP
ncbi:MAG: hypothetical protein JSS75_12550 [Bacteroidetes bacterium]|nr:hypothetical protein [Bacteroidota bacterium]